MILATRGGRNREVRAWAGSLLPTRSSDMRQAAGVTVSNDTTAGIPAFSAAVRIAAQAVATLDLGVYRGYGVERARVLSTWQARLFAGQPNDQQDSYQFKETIEESLTFRGNAYLWKSVDPQSGRVVELYALHPDQVAPVMDGRGGRRAYYVGVAGCFVDPTGRGDAHYEVGPETILHIKGFGDGGGWIAPSPVQRFAAALGISIAKMDHESNMFARGASINLAITYPETMTSARAREWRDLFRETYEGARGEKTAVFGGGATIQPIGLTQSDAQFIESSRFSIEEIARMTGVTASLIGGGSGNGGDAPITPEHEQARWLRHGLGPRLARIESAIRADRDLFGQSARDYPLFDTTGVVRGDVATEADVSLKKVQSGQWLVDEARALDGLPPLPDGVGSIPQIVPVGGAPNPNTAPVPPPDAPLPDAPPPNPAT